MKIIFICYNYLTLYKAINFIRYSYYDCECVIIFRTSVSDLPSNINRYFKVIEIRFDRKYIVQKVFSKYVDAIHWLIIINRTTKAIIKEIDTAKKLKLVVFKDNEKMESTFIEKFKIHTQQRGKVVLVEEGISIYEKLKPRRKLRYIWAIMQQVFGLSPYFVNNYPQGYNPLINKVVCADAKRFELVKGRNNLEVVEQNNIFTFENCKFFIENILGCNFEGLTRCNSFEFVFLTQPLSRIGWTEDMEKKIIERLLIITKKNILIKKHPRDVEKKEYSDKCMIFELPDELNVIPFECLYGIIGKPIIVTYFSSAYKNILLDNTNARVVLLYKLLKNERINATMNDLEKECDRRVFIPESLEQLDDITNWLSWLQVQV